MTDVIIDEQGRPEPVLDGDEATTLRTFLDYQRATLEWRCRGLSDEQLRARLAPTSMTLAGLLKHLAWVEDHWFTSVVARSPMPAPWTSARFDDDPDWEWTSALEDTGEGLRSLWSTCVERSRAVVEAELAGDADAGLAAAHPAWGGQGYPSLRWVMVHLVEEYARHNGHADLLREAIDGETGE